MDWAELETQIERSLGPGFRVRDRTPARRGDTSQTWRLNCAQGDCFLKLERDSRAGLLQAEAAGLAALARTRTIRTPAVLGTGAVPGYSYLLLEHLELVSLERESAAALGQRLAALHAAEAGDDYGAMADNFIGSTAQPNASSADWTDFFARQRLGHHLELAAARGASNDLIDTVQQVIDALPELLRGHRPRPSLLHGDLWAGNAAALRDGTPVVFDPAAYVGDREADIAMTELFGGFPPAFYAAYNEALALDSGYALRRDLYNLYHVLNHFNIFGGGYGNQAAHMSRRLLAAIR